MPSPIPHETSPHAEPQSRIRAQAKRPILVKPLARAANGTRKPDAAILGDWKPKSIFNLTGREQLFVSAFVSLRDVQKTAEKIGISVADAQSIYDQTHVYLLCAYECNRADAQLAQTVAKARHLTVALVDATLVRDLREMKPSMAKVKLIELGYHRLRVPIGPVEHAPAPPQPVPSVYAELHRREAERRAREEQERAAGQPTSSNAPTSTATPPPSTTEDPGIEEPIIVEIDIPIENY